ncbi:hypothetical protein CEXT_124141 [Caerostris extrusa]|uniref:Uncharacterized protein n=1 Tax=Caerostris extrusa TaxID=172846 RepID=A0AAV4MK58_CAEEX|nr:hypothetical protein CEXT_124141 [Caerostris extrusa]
MPRTRGRREQHKDAAVLVPMATERIDDVVLPLSHLICIQHPSPCVAAHRTLPVRNPTGICQDTRLGDLPLIPPPPLPVV